MKRRVLLLTLSPPFPRDGSTLFWSPYAYSSDRVAFIAPGYGGPNVPFEARISGQDDVVIERHASAWPFGRSSTQKAGVISLLNGDRALDALMVTSLKDYRYELRWCWEDEAADPTHTLAACTLWQSGVIERASTTDGDRRIVLTLADPLAYLDVPLQTAMYPAGFANVSERGSPLPITLGQVRFVSGVLRDTADVGADAWSYQLHDGHLRSIDNIYDKGDVFTVNDWTPLADRTGFKLTNKPDRPVVAIVQGETVDAGETPTVWDFKNGSWTFTDPNGWQHYGSNNSVTKVTQGARLVVNAGGSLVFETSTNAVIGGEMYRVDVDVAAYSAGAMHVRAGVTAVFGAVNYKITSTGMLSFYGTAASARSLRLHAVDAPNDMTIRSITMSKVLTTDRLPAFVRWIASKTFAPAYDTAAIAALDSARSYTIGAYVDAPITALTLLRRALDGWCGWVTSKRDGQMTVGRLGPRNGAGTVKLGRAQIISVRRSQDDAPGLTRRLAGLRNHTVHSDSDIATSVAGALRADLQAEYTIKTGSGAVLPPAYAHAEGADPRPTLLQDGTQLQAAADYVAALFRKGPFTWYEIDVALAAEIADGFELGDWIHVTHDVHGLDAGKWLCLMGATIRFYGRRATLTLIDLPETV